LVDALALDDSTWLVVLRAASGDLFAAPMRLHATGEARAVDRVRRAVAGDAAGIALTGFLNRQSGELRGAFGGRFTVTHLHPKSVDPGAKERSIDVDQTHESVVVGDRAVVKWAIAAEQTPAVTLVAHLAEAGFAEMAAPWGFVTWQGTATDTEARADPVLVASATEFLEDASDGWTWAVADASSYSSGATSLADATAPMAALGTVTADLHAALSTATSVIPDPRQRVSGVELGRWQQLGVALLAETLAEVDGDEGKRLRGHADQIETVLAGLHEVEATTTIPVHGDFHVGQILRWRKGYAVGDFDGNPVLPVAQRLERQPAARDVAGMIQSLDHVGRVVNRRVSSADSERTDEWITAAQTTFIDAYLSRLAHRGASDLFEERLLMPFQVEQECREFLYAVRHLPRWRYVPDQALQALLVHDARQPPATD
jgi:maltokinase